MQDDYLMAHCRIYAGRVIAERDLFLSATKAIELWYPKESSNVYLITILTL